MPGDPFRPAFHFSPRRNWMNDPNGLVWHDGEYHLFFQYNPGGPDWGNMSWGHAVSRDLARWEELPVALSYTDTEHVYSGSVVVDEANTSGLGTDRTPAMVAVYTSHAVGSPAETQSVAYSRDKGRTWTRYDQNPVLDVGSTDFRDPKVFWYEPGGHWVMVVVLAVERVVQLYRSDDLLGWDHLSDFGPAGAVSDLWECPDLFSVPLDGDPEALRWVLVVSVQGGAPAGGSGIQYFVGDFDGARFEAEPGPDPDGVAWVDHGADYYAAVSFADIPDGRRLLMGWMSNWAYAGAVPAADFRGAMSLPRAYELRSVDGRPRLVQQPVLPDLGGPVHVSGAREISTGLHPLPEECHGRHLAVLVELEPGTAERCGLAVRMAGAERTDIGYDVGEADVYVDRSRSGDTSFSDAFPAVHRAPFCSRDGVVRLQVYVDSTSVEVFAGDGEVVLTDQVFPSPESVGIALFVEGGTARLRSLSVTPMGRGT
ncbi:MAG TPA: glycoside hydrolase family 32 protein [Nocardioidaceae bacterium]